MHKLILAALAALVTATSAQSSTATYWSLFNIEGESDLTAQYVTYSALNDMLNDTNRLGVFSPNTFAGPNVVGSGSDGNLFWSLFNIEGENDLTAQYVSYSALDDMLNDTNRLGVFSPNTFAGPNVIGSGSDGDLYWSLFNIEGENDLTAQYVTYSTLNDMLNDTNRLGVFSPNTFAGPNVVGSGSDGNLFWSLFNIEGENDLTAQYVTYSALDDMLNDTNRLGVFSPNTFAGANVVGSGAFSSTNLAPIPLPASAFLLLGALGLLVGLRRRVT